MFILVIVIVGFSGLIAQVLLLRELLISFYGNELTVGIILANWVILEAAGALVFGRVIDRIKNKLAIFVALSMIFVISFPLCIWGARIFKLMLDIPIGLGVRIGSIVWVSLILSLPISLTHGALFSSCAKIYSLFCKSHTPCAGRVYFWETAGTILSGIILTYILIPRLNSFQIAGFIAILNIIVCLYLLYKQRFGFRMLKWFTTILLAIFISLFFVPGWSEIHKLSIKKQWQGFKVLDYTNSVYGNVVVTQRQEQYTFFSNGKPAITTPYPDLIFTEEFANIPLLFHQQPKKILIISRGAGGLINEVLKTQSVKEIDYVELDPLILNRLKKYSTDLTQGELEDRRVNTLNLDGRFFVIHTSSKYDVIYLGLSDPSDLQTNRLFTQEFFAKVRNRLDKGGILTFTLSGSMTYLAADLRDLNASIINSLKQIFPYVRVIPGDYNLFLASDSEAIIKIDSRLINQRIKTNENHDKQSF